MSRANCVTASGPPVFTPAGDQRDGCAAVQVPRPRPPSMTTALVSTMTPARAREECWLATPKGVDRLVDERAQPCVGAAAGVDHDLLGLGVAPAAGCQRPARTRRCSQATRRRRPSARSGRLPSFEHRHVVLLFDNLAQLTDVCNPLRWQASLARYAAVVQVIATCHEKDWTRITRVHDALVEQSSVVRTGDEADGFTRTQARDLARKLGFDDDAFVPMWNSGRPLERLLAREQDEPPSSGPRLPPGDRAGTAIHALQAKAASCVGARVARTPRGGARQLPGGAALDPRGAGGCARLGAERCAVGVLVSAWTLR